MLFGDLNADFRTRPPSTTKSLIVSNKSDCKQNPPAIFNITTVPEVNYHTVLGLTFSFNFFNFQHSFLRWNTHAYVDKLCIKANKRLNMMIQLKYKLDMRSLENRYKSFVRPVMEYDTVVWAGTPVWTS